MSASEAKSTPEAPGEATPGQGMTSSMARARVEAAAGPLEDVSGPTPSGPSAEAPTVKELVSKLTVGTVIDGKYAIEAIIGRGGMGVVVSARHVDLGREVALKFLVTGEAASPAGDLRTRFRREAQISAKLKNEHITRVLDVGVWNNASYIVMERLEGIDLRRKMKAGPLPLPLALNYTLQMCEGMAEAHAHGIVHRDLKPANLFVIRAADGTDLIKIMDFGISKWNGGEIGEITKDGTLLGSPKYMAPEQVFGTKAIDARADIWSIGAILFEMVAGRTPYVETSLARLCAALVEGPPPRLDAVRPDVPSRVADVVARALENSPSGRVQSVADLAGALLDAVDQPGQVFRDRLAAILAQRPAEESAPSTTNSLLTNLGNLGVSGSTPQPASEPLPILSGGPAQRPVEAGPPAAQTLPSPSARLAAEPAAVAPRTRLAPMIVAAVVAAAAAAFVAARLSATSPPPAPRPDPATGTPVATAAPRPPVTLTPTATAAPVEPPATAAATTAAPTATAAPTIAPIKGVKPHTPPHSTAQPNGKKGDDDIPSMR